MVRMHSDVKKFKWKQYYFEEQFHGIIDMYWINSLQNFGEDLFDALTKCFDLWQL